MDKTATAPYNFVSLPDKPLPSEIASVDAFKAHLESRGKISGELQLELETLTPLFIGRNFDDETVTFAPTGTPIIPGSTLRGMFKNIFKIVTCGTFRGRTESQRKGEDFNDEHVYFRCLMGVKSIPWTKDLNKLYNSRMTSSYVGKDKKIHQGKKAQPGFLIRTTDNKYFIAPSTVGDNKRDRISIFDRKFKNLDKSCVVWDGDEAYIFTGKGGKKKFVRLTKLSYVDWSRDHWIELPDDVRESYEHDRNRRGVNLFTDDGILNQNLPADVKSLIPCHFLVEGGVVTAFGHGQCFRIPYKNAIGDIVPAALKSTDVVDFADAVFGREKFWASRVAFEDAVPVGEIRTLGETTQILAQPNPTSFQLYLKQNPNPPLINWDSRGAQIRGYKMYWHNASDGWKKNSGGDNENMIKKLNPLAKGAKFKAKIRFKNLSAAELGALMMIFDLNGNGKSAAYKIGQGKPLGFGSVKITPKLFVESDGAYAELFDDSGWVNPYRAESPDKYLKAFRKHVDARRMIAVWNKVMRELNAILDWDKKPAPQKIKSMSGDVSSGNVDERFKQREILPSILDVVK